jgi:hypothetical protein
MRRSALGTTVAGCCAATVGYALLALGLTWPLARHLGTHLLGPVSGDAGVYVWNIWIFNHELFDHGHWPFFTDHVLAYTGGGSLGLHNYAPVASVLGAPFIGPLGVVGAHNVALLTFMALSGLGVFVLARYLGVGTPAALGAGALFIASPVLTARETGHFSLVIAAALPLFMWAILRTIDSKGIRDAILVGVLLAAASYSDAYYGIYCVMMGGFALAWQFCRVEWRGRAPGWLRLARTLNAVTLVAAALIAWRVVTGTTAIAFGPIRIGLQTLYTPILFLTCVVAIRAWLEWRPVWVFHDPTASLRAVLRLSAVALGVCLVLLLPQLIEITLGLVKDGPPRTDTYWRSSPRGVDALGYLVPNPSHPWFGNLTVDWFRPPDQPNWFPEFVASFSVIAIAVIAAGAWRGGLPRFWVAFTAFFVWVSLGPFIHVGGINTHVPGLWAFFRYAPVIGLARSPSRFAVVAILGMCLLFAFAVDALVRRSMRAPLVTGLLAAALALELMPAPRQLHPAVVPSVYGGIVAANDESGRLLDLPVGIHDGTRPIGDFDAATLYFQTEHRRPMIGAYLSRVSDRVKEETLEAPMLEALFALSEQRSVSPELAAEARASRDGFLRRSCVRFVVVNKHRTSRDLREFAIESLKLAIAHDDQDHALFTPIDPPDCESPPGRRHPGRW